MLPLEHPDRIQIAFDDHRLVNNTGLLLPATLALRAGPGDRPFTIDLDSTICETYGLAWARRAPDTTATPASGAITRCSPWPLAPVRC